MTKEEKCSATQKGRIVIHKQNLEKRVYKEELENYLKNGWEKGFSDNHKELNKSALKANGKLKNNTNGFKPGQKPWNYGKKAKDFPKLQAALDKAHKVAKEKGPWNKGLTKETDSRVKALAELERTEEWRNKIGESNRNSTISQTLKNRTNEQLQIQLTKAWITKKINGTTNTSKDEEEFYKKLLEENKTKTIYRNYKDVDRYPYYCDFYIVEDDLFIELNAHWTHGGRPFDENDIECIKQLNEWKEKAKTSKFYENAIQTWTVRDVQKSKCAKENNLNYKVIY